MFKKLALTASVGLNRPLLLGLSGGLIALVLVVCGGTRQSQGMALASSAPVSAPPALDQTITGANRSLTGNNSLPGMEPTPPVSPTLPLQAWSVAPDGPVFVLDADYHLYRLAPGNLRPLAKSPPLFEIPAETPSYLQKTYLLADRSYLLAGSRALTRTVVLSRTDFSPVATLKQVGPLALDSDGGLLVAGHSPVSFIFTGFIWRYNLNNLDEAPRQVVEQSCGYFSDLKSSADRLYALTGDRCASPPHRRQFYTIYDLDTLAETGRSNGQLGTLTRPALAPKADLVVTTVRAKNGLFGNSKLLLLNGEGEEIEMHQPLDGIPAVNSTGQWLYLLRSRGLWLLHGDNLALQTILPFTQTAPADLALSPDDRQLYLFGNDWLDSLPVEDLQNLGIPALTSFPASWIESDPDTPQVRRVRLYRPVAETGFGLIQVGSYSPYFSETQETYRTTNGGQTWHFLTDLTYPTYRNMQRLSFSPDFETDSTIVASTFSGLLRSQDGGDSWTEWTSPLAFVSDRDGDREIYVMNQTGTRLRQLTDSPATDENPAWSPAWTRLAFQSDRRGNWDIFSLRIDCQDPVQGRETEEGCDLRQLTDDPAEDMLPAWSPDGGQIAFVSTRDGNPEIYVMDHTGHHQRRLTFNGTGDWRPAWLPDSRHLVFTSDRAGNNDIYKLAVPPLSQEAELSPVVSHPADDRDPAVSSYGQLLFLSDRDGDWRVYTFDPESAYSRPRPAAETGLVEGHPSPVEDSPYTILLAAERNGNSDIYRVTGAEVTRLTTDIAFDGQPAWGAVLWSSVEPVPEQGRLK